MRLVPLDDEIEDSPPTFRLVPVEDDAFGITPSDEEIDALAAQHGEIKADGRSFLGGITEPVKRGLAQGRGIITTLASEAGLYGKDDQVELAVRRAEQNRQAERYPMPEDIAAGLQEIGSSKTMGEAAGAIVRNPRSVIEVALQSIGSSAPALVMAAGGSALGPAGTAAGAGAGSFAVEYGNTLNEEIAEHGGSPTDAMAVYQAMNDPEVMAAAREKATKRGVPIAVFDALTAGVAGRLLAVAKGAAKPSAAKTGAAVAGELGLQAAGGAAGEATAQAVTGEYRPGDILLEAAAEMPTALVEAPGNYRHARGILTDPKQQADQLLADMGQTDNIDDIINKAEQASGSDLMERAQERAVESEAQQTAYASDKADFEALLQQERDDVGQRRGILFQQQARDRDWQAAETQRETQKADELAAIRRDTLAQQADIAPVLTEAQGFDSQEPTAIQLAMQRAKARKATANTAEGLPTAVTAVDTAVNPQNLDTSAQPVQKTAESEQVDPSSRFEDPFELSTNEYKTLAKQHNLSPEQTVVFAPKEVRDPTTGFFEKPAHSPTIKRAIKYADENKVDAFYVDSDIGNLSGINDFYKNNHAEANKVLTAIADIFRDEMGKAGVKVIPIRHGGDEMSAVIMGGKEEAVKQAMVNAKARVKALAEELGLSQIKHSKAGKAAGVGLYLGHAKMNGRQIGEIVKEATSVVDREKKENQNGRPSSTTGALELNYRPRGTEPRRGGRPGDVGPGDGQVRGGTPGRVGESGSSRVAEEGAGSQGAAAEEVAPPAEAASKQIGEAASLETSSEPQPAAPVAESLASAPEAGDAGVATGQGGATADQPATDAPQSPSQIIADAMRKVADEIEGKKAEPKKVEASAPIGDFGEKIGGAKKDLWASYKDRLTDAEALDIKAEPLSKSWPAPDYQSLLDSGVDSFVVAFVRAARDAIPRKPVKSYKLKSWAAGVELLRDTSKKLIAGELSAVQAKELLQKSASVSRGMQDIAGRIELYEAVGHKQSLDGFKFGFHHYTLYKGQENVSFWSVEKDSTATAFSNWPTEFATGKTKEEALEKFKALYDKTDLNAKADRSVTFDLYTQAGKFYVGKKIGRNIAELAGPFDALKDARAYRTDHADELAAKLEKVKEIPKPRRDTNEPRVGEDMRNGQDVTPELFAETFGFKGVEFGNYVEQKKRQKDLNDSFDALMDMAAVLGVPPKALSLNGELGLAFGARGSGGIDAAAAHYERDKIVINLTKKEGAGSLGHEFWHALDNYFSRSRAKGGEMMTEALDVSLADRGSPFIENTAVRKEMIAAFGTVMRNIRQTALKARSSKLDAKRSKEYWTTKPEMSARAFESFLISKLQDQNASNDYLANVIDQETWKAAESLGFELDESYPYPTAGEMPLIREAFENFFSTLQTKETDKGVAMFSRGNRAPFYSALSRAFEGAKQESQQAEQWRMWLLSNAPKLGLKKAEIEWSGIDDWLKLQGKAKVSKAQIVDYLRENGVRVEETTLEEGDWAVYDGEENQYFGTRSEAVAYAEENGINVTEDTVFRGTNRSGGYGTKYASYQLPGGENYKELLLTLPEKTSTPIREMLAKKYGKNGRSLYLASTPEEQRLVDAETAQLKVAGQSSFRSNHFDQPNILAHVRFNERVDADGRKVLFIEEIQGDWQQEYRKQTDLIAKAVDDDFLGIVKRMEADGVLEVNCD